ncbi:MAG: type VII secretion protein EccC, partial [Actinobacteria bacterium]|nr:type VII secretion protein EccC [Actinomycetota bacterium]
MRQRFKLERRRLPGPALIEVKDSLAPPPELPRVIETHDLRKAMPWIVGGVLLLVVGWLVVTGARTMNITSLIFMGFMAATMVMSQATGGGNQEMSKKEVDAERADYLRYLSQAGAKYRQAGASQRAVAEWSHPDPEDLPAHVGERRMWERGNAREDDYLKIRIGRSA